MATCTMPGDSDMYGFGIRISFYIQWYSTILSTWLAPSETDGFYLSTAFLVSATFLALLIQTINSESLKPVEIYIILLLSFGAYLSLVPLYLLRSLTCYNGKWDPTRYSRVPASPVFGALNFGLLVIVSGFQLWFWTQRVPSLNHKIGCQELGFLFQPVRLDSRAFIIFHKVFYVLLLVFCVGMLGVKVARRIKIWEAKERQERKQMLEGSQILVLQKLNSILDLIVASTVTAATELTIRWNNITGVTNISSAGQTIPLILSVAMLIRVFYVFQKYLKNGGTNPFTTIPASREPDDLDRFIRFSAPMSNPVPVVEYPRRDRNRHSQRGGGVRVLVV